MGTVLLVLSPTRSHRRLLEFALSMAERERQPLLALYVIDTRITDTLSTRIADTGFLGDRVSEEVEETVLKQYEERGEQELSEVTALAAARGITCKTTMRKGDLVVECLRAAREAEAGAIVISRAERFDIARKLFGSAVDDLREQAPCPVFVVGEDEDHRAAGNG